MKFTFRELIESDLPQLRSWLRESHVAEFWQETADEDEFRQKFLIELGQRGVRAFVVSLNGRAVGFIQSYEAARVGGGWWPDIPHGVYGIDQFIGEAELIGKGYGTELIKQFCAELFAHDGVREIITDPDPRNGRAIRAFEKAGFTRLREITTPGGAALLMSKKRVITL